MKATILLIEDSPTDIQLMTRMFAKAKLDAELLVARDGDQAMDVLKKGASPVLVLMDWNMPGLSGQGLLVALKAWVKAPVCVLTTADPALDARPSSERIEDHYFEKPVGIKPFMELMDEIRLLIQRS